MPSIAPGHGEHERGEIDDPRSPFGASYTRNRNVMELFSAFHQLHPGHDANAHIFENLMPGIVRSTSSMAYIYSSFAFSCSFVRFRMGVRAARWHVTTTESSRDRTTIRTTKVRFFDGSEPPSSVSRNGASGEYTRIYYYILK